MSISLSKIENRIHLNIDLKDVLNDLNILEILLSTISNNIKMYKDLISYKLCSYNINTNKFESFFTNYTNYKIEYEFDKITNKIIDTIGIFSFKTKKECIDYVDVIGGVFDFDYDIAYNSKSIPIAVILNTVPININNILLILIDNVVDNNLLTSYYTNKIHEIKKLNQNDRLFEFFDIHNIISNRNSIVSEFIYTPSILNKNVIDKLSNYK